jgi:TolA-binding protein
VNAHGVWICVGVSLIVSCAHPKSPFDQGLIDAEQARRAKQLERSQTEFDQALSLAKSDNERAEAMYRKAHALLREGQLKPGLQLLLHLAMKYPRSNRAARAWLDRGRYLERAGELALAEQSYRQVFSRYPEYGGAITAARQIVKLRTLQGESEIASFQRLRAQNKDRELDAALRYFAAVAAEKTDKTAALSGYEELAALYPLPRGTYTDEALLRAAALRRTQLDYDGALSLLQKLTKQDKKASVVGSYTRAAYLDAYLLRGQILRDNKQDFTGARREFQHLLKRRDHSTVVDEALFELALVELRDKGSACPGLATLKEHRPDSKYLECSPQLCRASETAEPMPTAQCATWVAQGTATKTRLR